MKYAIFTVLVAACAFLPQARAAESCPDVRLDQKEGPLAHVPIYDQDSFGSCYAYTAAELIDAYRFSHGDSYQVHLTSPVALTVNYSKDYDPSRLELINLPEDGGGSPSNAILAAKKYGSCDKRITDMILSGKSEQDFYHEFVFYAQANAVDRRVETTIDRVVRLFEPRYTRSAEQAWCSLRASDLPKELIPNLKAIAEDLDAAGDVEAKFMSAVINRICKPGTIPLTGLPDPTHEEYVNRPWSYSERASHMRTAIDGFLNQTKPQPIGLSFCSKTIVDKNYPGVPKNTAQLDESNCGRHAAVIAGSRRAKGGGCEYLLRNSSGVGCEKYRDKGVECEEKTGQIWIDSDRLARSAYGTTVLR